jgi:hypothetical protein
MGALVIKEMGDVWGGGSSLILDLIDFGIEENGEQPYLVNFRNQFEWGFKTIYIFELTEFEKKQFLESTIKYLATKSVGKQAEDLLIDLIRRMGKEN